MTARNESERVKREAKRNVRGDLGETIEQDLRGGNKENLWFRKTCQKDRSMYIV